MWVWRPPRCGLGDPPGQTPQLPPWVWVWKPPGQTPQLPPWVWAWRPPGQTPQLPPGCGPGEPLRPGPSTSPPGCMPGDLQGMLRYHPPAARHAGIPPAMHVGLPPRVNRITDKCKNITLPQLRCGWQKRATKTSKDQDLLGVYVT